MRVAPKHRQHACRIRPCVERRIRYLASRHALLAIAVGPIIVVFGLVFVLLSICATVAVKTVIIVWRLTIAIVLVVCLNIFRTFPG